MANSKTPGVFQAKNGDPTTPGNPPQAGFQAPPPVGAGAGDNPPAGGPTLVGWPRTIGWGEFRDIETRPAGESENAQIDAQAIQPENVAVVREDGQRRLGAYTVNMSINRSNSWVVTSQKTPELRSHEQGHYNILGLSTRQMVHDLRDLRAETLAELGQRIQEIIAEADSRGDGWSESYDDDTEHGVNTTQQQAWDEAIQAAMESGSNFSPP